MPFKGIAGLYGTMNQNVDSIELFNESNAIEVANFCVYLDTPIDHADIRRLNENLEVKGLYPAISSPNMLQLAITNQELNKSSPPPVPVLQLYHYRPNGKPDWTGSFGETRILVSCHFYTNWKNVWSDAKKRLNLLLGCVDPYKNIFSIDYSITDTFKAKKTDESLVPLKVFRDNDLIAKHILSSQDYRWDFSQGWFEKSASQDQVLMRIEGQGAIENDVVIASIGNLHSHRLGTKPAVKDLFDPADGNSRIYEIFENFHNKNKDLLRELLVDGLLDRMGLKE